MDKILKEMEDKVKRENVKIMKPKIKIVKKATAFKSYAASYEINIIGSNFPLLQLTKTRNVIKNHIKNILKVMKGLKFVETLKITSKKSEDKNKLVFKTAYFSSKSKEITNETQIFKELQSSQQQILKKYSQRYK